MACDAKTCVLDVLAPVFGDEAGDVAMNYTCFPMNCDVASEQARQLLERVAALGKQAALAEAAETIDREMEAACAPAPPPPNTERGCTGPRTGGEGG